MFGTYQVRAVAPLQVSTPVPEHDGVGDGETEDAVVVDTIDDAGDPVDVVIPMSVELDKPRGDPVESDDDDVSKEGEAVVEAMDAVVEEMEEDVDKLEAAVEDELVVSDESEELLKIEVAGRLVGNGRNEKLSVSFSKNLEN